MPAPGIVQRTTLKALLLVSAAALMTCSTDAGRLEKVDLFRAGEDGYAHFRVPAIAVSPQGTVFAFAEARRSSRGDWGTQDIVMRRSTDGGRSWEPSRVIARLEGEIAPNPVALAQNLAQPGEVTYNNVVPIVDRVRGWLHVLFCVEYARCYAMRSSDEGVTFSEPADITPTFEEFLGEYPWKVIATGPGHGIQLSGGRLLVPVWLSDGTGGHAHRPSCVSVIYSDDHGETWRRGEIVTRHPELKNPSETVAVELSDGSVALNIRNESPEHRRAISISRGGATGWSRPEFHPDLIEPVCMASVLALPPRPGESKKRLVFANPLSEEPRDPAHPEGNWKRQNVTVRLSYDEGRTWPVARALEPGPSGYSDLAADDAGTIYCIYERGVTSEGAIAALTVARFNLEWLAGAGR